MTMTSQRGMSFVELMVAISIVSVSLMVMLTQITISYRETDINEMRVFAYRKAMAMVTELQNGIERGDIPDAEFLDSMQDLKGHNPILTTLADGESEPFDPGHPMSGNVLRHGDWRWSRVIEVTKFRGQERLRYVRVKVFANRGDGDWDLQASVGGVMALRARAAQSQKYYDVYVLALSEAPSMWLPTAQVRAMLDTARTEIQTIDNGLKLRFHWITQLGYGRDPIYTPFVNQELSAEQTPPPVYWYPGVVGQRDLYTADAFGGRVRTEAEVLNDHDEELNPHPHSVADQFNHCLRLPAARELFERRVAAGLERAEEPPLQLLLEDMLREPDRYRNAIFVNLHGSALPMPPLRNYSDAAKEPIEHPGVRVVTHPERLWTRRDPSRVDDSQDAAFRVYAYKTDPDEGDAILREPITLQVEGVDLTDRVNAAEPGQCLEIKFLGGGVGADLAPGQELGYRAFERARPRGEASPGEMCYELGYVGGDDPHTWIKLYNTPLVAPLVGDAGLARSERLYGLEYIPSAVASDEFHDLSLPGAARPKNTARWQVTLPRSLFNVGRRGGFGGNADRRVTVVTRIGDDMASGTAWPEPREPHNTSTTYTWWATSPAAVPYTERHQFQGDPRHNPYIDLMAGDSSMAHGYNWQFDDLRESLVDVTGKWPGLDRERLQDGFGSGVVADAPRLLQLLRRGLQRTGSVFVNPTGVAAHSLVIGGEIALPSATAGVTAEPVLAHGSLLGLERPAYVDTISPALPPSSMTTAGRHVVVGDGPEQFWAMEWLGELFPDSAYRGYLASGNLPTGVGPGAFHREPRSDAVLSRLPAGTDFNFSVGGALGLAGSVALFDADTLAGSFMHVHEVARPVGGITEQALAIASATGDALPEEVPAAWPFGIRQPFPGQLPYFEHTDQYPKSTLSMLEQYYSGSGPLASAGLVALRDPRSAASAFFVVMGLTPSTPGEHGAVAIGSLMLGLRAFHRAGEPTVADGVQQFPLVEVLKPHDSAVLVKPSHVELRWKTPFSRFDGESYTTDYPAGFAGAEGDFVYSLLYSRDDGETWRNALNSAPATPGVRPAADLLLPDEVAGAESFALPTPPGSYVGAEYILRVECFHETSGSHFSTHETKVLLTR